MSWASRKKSVFPIHRELFSKGAGQQNPLAFPWQFRWQTISAKTSFPPLLLLFPTQGRMLKCLFLLIIWLKCLSSQGCCLLKCELAFACIHFPAVPLLFIFGWLPALSIRFTVLGDFLFSTPSSIKALILEIWQDPISFRNTFCRWHPYELQWSRHPFQ